MPVHYDQPMGFGRVDDHVKGWVQRSYLEQDGWWAQLVLDEFAFLDDLGFSLTEEEWVGVHFHQKGHYVCFAGPRGEVVIAFDPDDPRWWAIGADVVTRNPPRRESLDHLISRYLPEARPPAILPLDRPAVEANVRWWADGLRRIASDVL
jgi:hypothetical protein